MSSFASVMKSVQPFVFLVKEFQLLFKKEEILQHTATRIIGVWVSSAPIIVFNVPKLPSTTIKTIGMLNVSFICFSRSVLNCISSPFSLSTTINDE